MAIKDLGKIGHQEDRTLSDVAEVKTFDSGSKGRVTSQKKCKSTQKFDSKESSKDNEKESCDSSFQVTKW